MFQKIAASIQHPLWVRDCPRFRRLDLYDRLLDGTFYDKLGYAFYDETDPQGKPIKLELRRPSVQMNFPYEVATYCARKLFAGNHAPRMRHKDEDARKAIAKVLRAAKFLPTMCEAAKLGSVGSVAVSFRIEDNGKQARIAMNVWRAKYCEPSFDSMGELSNLRVQYVVDSGWMKAIGAPGIEGGRRYWLIRDYGPQTEITYVPPQEADWDPVHGFIGAPEKQLERWETIQHNLGFVPAQWIKNLPGGEDPDGDCTWRPGIPNSIEMDYTGSQLGRGVRYNACPQPVIVGEIINGSDDGSVTRGPTHYIHLAPAMKGGDGQETRGEGKAFLLEMNGAGLEASIKFVDKLRDIALEVVAAARKDPEKMKGPMSGRAMEFIDQEFYDLVMELRTHYGENGALPLARKIVQAVAPGIDVGSMTLIWPRLFQPTPNDLGQLLPALAIAVNPFNKPPPSPAIPGSPGGEGGAGTPETPEVKLPGPDEQLLTLKEARDFLLANMDIDYLNADNFDPDEPVDGADNTPETAPPAADTAEAAPNLEGGIPRPMDETRDD